MATGHATIKACDGRVFEYDVVEINGHMTLTGIDGVFEYVSVSSQAVAELKRRLEECEEESDKIRLLLERVEAFKNEEDNETH